MENFRVDFIGDINNVNKYNDNIDVYVHFSNGETYTVTFFTVENINTLMSKFKKTGECNYGKYFWATDMCIINEISEKAILDSIEYMLKNGEFKNIFTAINTM